MKALALSVIRLYSVLARRPKRRRMESGHYASLVVAHYRVERGYAPTRLISKIEVFLTRHYNSLGVNQCRKRKHNWIGLPI